MARQGCRRIGLNARPQKWPRTSNTQESERVPTRQGESPGESNRISSLSLATLSTRAQRCQKYNAPESSVERAVGGERDLVANLRGRPHANTSLELLSSRLLAIVTRGAIQDLLHSGNHVRGKLLRDALLAGGDFRHLQKQP